ncbi:DUF3391 domain-containing protein, partial [Vibrio sp. 03_296]|uniref:DUF3391 domain-containing protein n=1 Tax=Vibrio sp. 03_296 TaxID=2024409 RepID=UPI002D7E8164
MANAGRVQSEKAITRLFESGVKFVWVDAGLSAKNCVIKPAPKVDNTESQVVTESHSPTPRKQPKSRASNQKKAKKLIAEAKGLAQKLL